MKGRAEKEIKVSILCTTYNHAKFIRQALDGFLMQKTTFDFEILINDDASTDGTTEILKEYAAKNKNIKLVLHEENLFSKGYRNMMIRFLLPKARGEYIALCEGDDYWTDPDKLQTQVDYMDSHTECSLCFHKVLVKYEDESVADEVYPNVSNREWYTKSELLKVNYIQTNSVLYRRQKKYELSVDVMPSDWYLHMYHAYFGEIALIEKVMSVYRKHPGGIWWEYDKERSKIWKNYGIPYLKLWLEVENLYADKKEYANIIDDQIVKALQNIIDTDNKYKTKLTKIALTETPGVFIKKIIEKTKEVNNLLTKLSKEEQNVAELKKQLYAQSKTIMQQSEHITNIQKELNVIINSKTWRTRSKAVKIIRKPKE